MDLPEIDLATLQQELDQGAVVLDVREADEFQEARIPGVQHIPLMELPTRLEEVQAPVYVVCASGGRSRKAVEFMRRQGLEATNVAGGTKAWLAEGLPYETGG